MSTHVYSETFTAIGTTWHIDVKNTEQALASGVFLRIRQRIEQFEQHYSRFRKDSLISEVAQKAGVYLFPQDAGILFALYRKLYDITEGAVTPLIGQLLVDTGYDATYSLTPKQTRQPTPTWDTVMKFDQKTNILVTYVPVQLDFGALGKGYIVDIVSQMILDAGISSFTVDAGGDIHHRGDMLKVGLEHPHNKELAIGIATLTKGSICGSSGNRRSWHTFHHILNPHTQESPTEITALWVTADSTMIADGLSTALFFVEPEKLREHFTFEFVLMHSDGSAFASAHFPGTLF